MNTSYDEIFSTFMDNNLAEDIDLPQTDPEIYRYINNGVKFYNNQERDNLICDDAEEKVSRQLNNDEVLIIAHYIRYAFLKNQLSGFLLTYQPFGKDMGFKNYDSQVRGLGRIVDDCMKTITTLRHNKEVDIF